MKPLGVALLGCGHFYHAGHWADALADSPDVNCLGVWDRDGRRGQAFAREHGLNAWPTLDALLAADGLDAVAVCAENDLHADLIAAAAAAGRHVYCEKPMAPTLADCDRAAQAVERAGVLYGQSLPKRYDPLHRELVRMVRDGAVGQVACVRLRHGHAATLGGMPGYAGSWFTDPARNGGGSFLDEGIHAADLLNWLVGQPTSAVAMMMRLDAESAIDQAGMAVYGFDDGTIGEIASGSLFAAATNTTEVYGREGAIVVAGTDGASKGLGDGPKLLWHRSDWPTREWRPVEVRCDFGTPRLHQNGLLEFVRCVAEGARPSAGVAEARAALETILAAYAAARENRRVTLPLAGDFPYRVDELIGPVG